MQSDSPSPAVQKYNGPLDVDALALERAEKLRDDWLAIPGAPPLPAPLHAPLAGPGAEFGLGTWEVVERWGPGVWACCAPRVPSLAERGRGVSNARIRRWLHPVLSTLIAPSLVMPPLSKFCVFFAGHMTAETRESNDLRKPLGHHAAYMPCFPSCQAPVSSCPIYGWLAFVALGFLPASLWEALKLRLALLGLP